MNILKKLAAPVLGALASVVLVVSMAYAIGGSGWNEAIGNWQFRGLVRMEDDVHVYQTLTVDGATTLADLISSDDLTATDDLYVESQLIFDEEGTITIESDGDPAAFTPTGTFQKISSAGATGTSAITILEEGTLLILYNAGAQTITFTDTGTLKLSGNAALGSGDTLSLISDGTSWIQVAPEGDN
jgi:hypothetical protein